MAVERFLTGKPETVRKLNALVDAVKSLQNINGDIFIRTANTPAGTTIRLNIAAVLERIMKNSGGGGGGGIVGWFKLTSVSSDPMTGQRQICTAGSFSSAGGGTDSIYSHPQGSIANYVVDDIIFANFVGDCWVAVNEFSSIENVLEFDSAGNLVVVGFVVCET